MKKLSILFFGSDIFASKCLRKVASSTHLYSKLEVVLPFSKAHQMMNVVQEFQLQHHAGPVATMRTWEAPETSFDLAVVVSFGHFLPSKLLQKFKYGGINLHPSLLPKYRGASPIQYTIINRDKEVGVSVINVSSEAFDAGRILNQSKFELEEQVSFDVLRDRMANIGADLLVETIENLEERRQKSTIQDETMVTHAPRIHLADSQIDWLNDTTESIYARFLAYGSKTPLFTYFLASYKKIQLVNIAKPDNSTGKTIQTNIYTRLGSIVYDKISRRLYVLCNGGWLEVLSIKVDGKRILDPREFFNGYQWINHREFFKYLESPPLPGKGREKGEGDRYKVAQKESTYNH